MGLLPALFLQGCAAIGSTKLSEEIESYPPSARYRVHAHFINSPLDVPQLGRLAAVASFFREAGLPNTTFHMWSSGSALAAMVLDLRAQDPQASVALIGWSGASLWIWDALNMLRQSGQVVQLVVYLDSNWIKERTKHRGHPGNADEVLLIYRADNPPVDSVPNSRVKRVATRDHLTVAAHPEAVQAMGGALLKLLSKTNVAEQ